MRNLRHLFSIAPLVLAACSDTTAPAAPRSVPTRPLASITDTPHGGPAGFYFLAPIVQQPKYRGVFDGSRSVTVLICPLGGSATSAPATSCTGGSTALAVEVNTTGQSYHTNWKIDPRTFPSGSYYRISVVETANYASEFAHVDVYLGKAPAGFNHGEYVTIPGGATPIKFRIEPNAQAGGGGTGGTGGTPSGAVDCVANPNHVDCQAT